MTILKKAGILVVATVLILALFIGAGWTLVVFGILPLPTFHAYKPASPATPHSTVQYSPFASDIRDFIKGDGTVHKETFDIYPLVTEGDYIMYVIRNNEQKKVWKKEYTVDEIVSIAYEELGRAQKNNDSPDMIAKVARIQSIIDILSK